MGQVGDWLAGVASLFAADAAVGEGGLLREQARYKLPLAEVSGLALTPTPPGAIRIQAVGDAEYAVADFLIDEAGKADTALHAVSRGWRLWGAGASQWEAIAEIGRAHV
jgi:hypothetical protein